MPLLTEEADRLAEAAAGDNEDAEESASADAAAPAPIKVNLGSETVELDPDEAAIVKRAFDTLHGRYGAELDQLRAQAFQQMGRAQAQPAQPPPATREPIPFTVPEPDLLFSNKKTWEAEFARQLDAREASLRRENEALVHAAVSVIQEDLNARETRNAAQTYEGQLFDNLMAQHETLRGHDAFVWSVMDEIYDNIRHLPAHVAYDRLGEVAEARWNEIRGSNGNGIDRNADLAAADASRRSPTPKLLTSGRRGAGDTATPQARVSITDRILERQERFLNGARPAK